MYKCRHCGSTEIHAEGTIASGHYTGEPPKIKGGYATYEIGEWNGVDTWVCASCRKESEDLDDLAEWSDGE